MRGALQRALRRLKSRIAGSPAGNEHHNRGLDRFDAVLRSAGLASLSDQLAQRLAGTGTVRVLEIGCGEGRLLLDVLARFGDAVELHGINHERWPVVADARGLRATNARYRILPSDRLRQARHAPMVHLADAEDLSRFPAGRFDLVVSQVVVAHVRRKDRVLEESARLLAPDGVFIHEIDHLDPAAVALGGADLPRFALLGDGAPLSATAHLERHGIGIRHGKAAGPEIVVATYRQAGRDLALGLTLDAQSTVVLKSLAARDERSRLWGVRSVYRPARTSG